MARALLEQAFETCQKNKSDWMSSKSALARAEMALKELELTCTRYEPEAAQALRDDIDLKNGRSISRPGSTSGHMRPCSVSVSGVSSTPLCR